MEIKNYIRIPNVVKGIDVTKMELVKLVNDGYPISISQHDKDLLKQFKDNEYVGTVMGDVDNIFNNKKSGDMWFVNKFYMDENYQLVKGENND
jgi:hypothetical protein